MLTSIGLGVFIACVIYVVIWSVKNDGASSIEDQDGFIRMRAWKRPTGPAARRQTTSSPSRKPPTTDPL